MENISKQAEQYFDSLIKELEVPESSYEQAEKSYKSFSEFANSEKSGIRDYQPEIYVQGSFRLGTAIKPPSDEDEYDIDLVCSLAGLDKHSLTQSQLKELLGNVVKLYHQEKGIKKPVKEGQRCWTLEYSDSAQFHMDILPSLPNGDAQKALLESQGYDSRWSDTAIAITDNKEQSYHLICDEWPRSNPKGFSDWFKKQMEVVFEKRRQGLYESSKNHGVFASIEEIPDFKVRTPLQHSVMLLKRHRDQMFKELDSDLKPISIIISTLAAQAYSNEDSIGAALKGILTRFENNIGFDGFTYQIYNPTDRSENFADKWPDHPERQEAFFAWLNQVKKDFGALFSVSDLKALSESTKSSLGTKVSEAAFARSNGNSAAIGTSLLSSTLATEARPKSTFEFPEAPRKPSKPRDFA